MDGIGALRDSHLQEDPLAVFSSGLITSSPGESSIDATHEQRMADSFPGGLGRLRQYIDAKLKLSIAPSDGTEMDFHYAAELTSTLGTEMDSHMGMAVQAQRYIDSDRTAALLY